MKGRVSQREREYLAMGVFQAYHPSLGAGVTLDKAGIDELREALRTEVEQLEREIHSLNQEDLKLDKRKEELLAILRCSNP
ncbi:hypothetical protein GMRT_15511 [Giardia muris]|uniref:Uncharacterized protein n=1 Tax=Giardia muris TaxID=5742 RepID=A0A4Z1SVM0_GIAMU|nr:hypothetical protein GMRT_15511 [Giardia muris]|eukprot:TNJ29836.1 hypothetical protein GMRT_15511 [Giardia muris]